MVGTLNGNDTDNQTVYTGDDRELECDLVPADAADRLDGVWTVQVYGDSVQVVSVQIVDGRAKVMPPDPPGRYTITGEVLVKCLFQTPDGDPLYEFNRSVTVTDPDLGRLRFDPSDGLLHVGSSETIACHRDVEDESASPGAFTLVDVHSRTQLLSTDSSVRPVVVKPPEGKSTYTEYGSTTVLCSFEDDRGRRLERNLTVRILPAHMVGTLNGNDTDNQTVHAGDDRELECDLVPADAAGRLDGVWTVQVYGDSVQIVSVQIVDGRAKVVPPDPPGRYTITGEVLVKCLFQTPDGDPLYEFNRSVTVTDPDLGRLRFDPSDGLLHVGSSETIACHRDVEDESASPGAFTLVDVHSRTQLLSTDSSVRPVVVKPPEGKSTYTEYGSTTVLCSFEDDRGRRLERNLTVRILPAHMVGTLNGNDTDNQTVHAGDDRELECDLVPADAAGRLDGVWTVQVYGDSVQIVSVQIVDGRAKVVPPDPPGRYTITGEVLVKCLFQTPDGDPLYEFNRSVTVTDPDLGRLRFDPSDGLLHVGSSETIACHRDVEDESASPGEFTLVDVHSRTQLLSTDSSVRPVVVKPPEGKSTYTEYGSTTVLCSFEDDRGRRLERNLTVRILPADMVGTLNGNDTDNQTVYTGDDRELECDLVPADAADRLDGVWTVQVYGDSVQVVSVQIVDGRAKVMPPDPPGRYTITGEVLVKCLFQTPDGDPLYEFNRSVTVTDPDLGRLRFDPSDGLLHVGSSETIACHRDVEDESASPGEFTLVDVHSRTQLLSTDSSVRPVVVKPPEGKSTYTEYGSTTVLCSFEDDRGRRLERNLTVRILPAHMAGTLNGNDTDNQTVHVGDDRELECDLVPADAAGRLDGVWTVQVYGDSVQIVSVQIVDGRAKVVPPDPPGRYTTTGEVLVKCLFQTPDGDPLYEFNRSVTVTDTVTTTTPSLSSTASGSVVKPKRNLSEWQTFDIPDDVFVNLSHINFYPPGTWNNIWWLPLMVAWFLVLLGTAILIGQLCGFRRDWAYSRLDLQHMLRKVDAKTADVWTPNKPIPPAPELPSDLVDKICLHRDMLTPETFQTLQKTVGLYRDYANLVSLWNKLWLAKDRDGLITSSELFIDYLQRHRREEDRYLPTFYGLLQKS
ncbi:unnamed protein product [Dicrocoelium dendriticum]|nr:unnamed protein product [Dicrocoelium dendriticum]